MINAYSNYLENLNKEELQAELQRQKDIFNTSKNANIRQRAYNKMMFCKQRLYYMGCTV